ncbi:MAG: GGDEF domain-containing protein [Gammaproteobacteria bacterium]|nr:GGDEF domain-containing protein [Gammaproteobacteria bacterium]
MCAQPRDASQRPAAQRKAAAATQAPAPAEADALTGLLSRAAFDERLAQEERRAHDEHDDLSLLLIDIDHFRAYVDTHRPRMVEDRLKKIAATLMQAVFRPTDLVARFGDDEFAILLPGVHEGGAQVVAARARTLINSLAMRHSAGEGGIVTVSIGVAALAPEENGGAAQLVDLCKSALEQAKRMGRDNIVSQDWMA